MAVALPLEPVFYYECFNGEFRLTYFIPYQRLEKLVSSKKIDAKVLRDFPLGLDLNCNLPDYQDFYSRYGYRPRHDPETICDAFLAIYSSSKDWKKFRGTGIIAAKELENYGEMIDQELKKKNLKVAEVLPPPKNMTLTRRKARVIKKLNLKRKKESFLKNFKTGKVDQRKAFSKQSFTDIAMEKDKESTKEFYNRLHKNKQR